MTRTLARVKEANVTMRQAQKNAREIGAKAWRDLEDAVTHALGGESLRGAPNLMPDADRAFQAWRIHGNTRAWLPRDGSSVLVVLRTGLIAWARWERTLGSPQACWRRPTEHELRVEDFEAYAEVVEQALQVHLTATERSTGRYEVAEALATRLRSVLSA